MIELVQLVKKFGDLAAVNDVSLKINAGEFFALLGPNAAGKTTLMKLLTGLIKPTAGHARICGFDVQTQPLEARRRLAYVPDFPFLYDKLTPWEFFRFIGGSTRRASKKTRTNWSRAFTWKSSPTAHLKACRTARASASPSFPRCCTIRRCS